MKTKKIKSEEDQILDDFEAGLFKPAKNQKKLVKELKQMASKQLKTDRVTLRLNLDDRKKVEKEANRLGIPYQSLLGSIIHRYANGSFLDVENIEALKTLKKMIT